MRCNRALTHTSSVGCLETFRSIFAVTLPLVHANSRDAQVTVPNDHRYARLGTNLGIGQAKKGKGRIEAFPTGSPHTNTIAFTAEIESGSVAKNNLIPFRCSPDSLYATPLETEASRAAHVMGVAIPNVLQPGAFVWFEKRVGPQMKVLPVPG
ncbi:uncharacterized protein TNCV_1812251 [Trichonephila clavipes]|uniref:Uncharacterized protein n=1 Tax=Trichonephila clavipes TaxID=2585209 RepID=A0A8X6W7D5_TRICX|nr:uncharacterized protein TNCV_1812251 [Trichonephila clavipes]